MVRVEHVTVEAGGQAIVGTVMQRGEGMSSENVGRPHAKAALAHAPEPALRGTHPEREPVPVAGGPGRKRCRMHGGAPAAARRRVTATPSSMAAIRASWSNLVCVLRGLLRENTVKIQLA